MRHMLVGEPFLGGGPVVERLRPIVIQLLIGLIEAFCRGIDIIHGLIVGIYVVFGAGRAFGVERLLELVEFLLFDIEIRELGDVFVRRFLIKKQGPAAGCDQAGVAFVGFDGVERLQTFHRIAGKGISRLFHVTRLFVVHGLDQLIVFPVAFEENEKDGVGIFVEMVGSLHLGAQRALILRKDDVVFGGKAIGGLVQVRPGLL